MKHVQLVIASVLLFCGCETYRYEYLPSVDATPCAEQRYSLKDCVFYYVFNAGEERREHRDTFQTESFSRDELSEMMRMYPDVFSDNGIPVTVKLCRDMDRSGSGSLCSVLSGILYLGTVGIVPGVFASDNFVEVVLTMGEASTPKCSFEMKESKRQTYSSSGLNLLFPFSSPTFGECSRSGCANLFTDGERCSWSIGMGVDSRCRKDAYAFAIAVALSEHERKCKDQLKHAANNVCSDRADGKSANGAVNSKEWEGKKTEDQGSHIVEMEQIPL